MTGGSGCLGMEIVRQLVASGNYVVQSLDLFIPPKETRIPGVYMYIQADVTNKNHVERALEGIDVVFHTVALVPTSIRNTPQAMQRVNVDGTKNIVSSCKSYGVKRLIYTSSITVVIGKDKRVSYEGIDEDYPLPKNHLNAYVKTKCEAEIAVREANGENGLRTCALRLGGIIGGRNNRTTGNFTSQSVTQLGSANWIQAWTEHESAAKLHLLAEQHLAKKALTAETNVFNVVSFNTVYKDVVSFFASENTGKKPLVVPIWACKVLAFINEAVFRLTGYPPFGDQICLMSLDFLVSFSCSTQRTEKELGWAEKRPWQEVLKKVIADYNNVVKH